ncbi:hypothetical protein [Streptomyces chattanoogensis]|uniref:hypothetical protein n=1 Tax=Streptomyces chattanoogensis TaxID=66876 RepID=UPI00367B2D99
MSDPNTTDPGNQPNQDPTSDPVNTTDPNQDPRNTPDPTPDTKDGDDALGDAGKKALKTERDARKAAEKELAELKDEVSRLRRSNAATKGTDLDAIKAEIRAEYASQLAETAIKAEAKGRLADPSDALLYIKTSDVAEGDDAIKAAIDKLLINKPYLAAQDGRKHWGDVGGGQRTAPEPEPSSPEERMRRAYSRKAN